MKKKEKIHIIDDEPIIHEVLGDLLTAEGYEVESSSRGDEALKKFPAHEFDLVLLDLLMPGMDGIKVLSKIKEIDPDSVVIIITAYASVESALSAMKSGAFDYIQKPFKHNDLLLTVKRALEHKQLRQENLRLKKELKKKFGFGNIIGKSKVIQNVFDVIQASAPTRSTILIQGESGTGKELVAHAVHQHSDRANYAFISVNSGSLPPDLLESHLFGHMKGAFTGAVTQKKGLFEAADLGTIFFDEISSIGLETQAKLLRVMQEKEFMRLGDTRTMKVDVRVIAATNIDLEDMILARTFRNDLYYRLNVIKIEIPPLRERKEDIPLLVKHFLEFYSRENNKKVKSCNEDVMEVLEEYHWPGNIRELENLIERAVVLSKSQVITRENLPPMLISPRKGTSLEFSLPGSSLHLKEQTRLFQKQAIVSALKRTGGIQKKAAVMLGLKPTTLSEMIKRLDIDSTHLLE